MLNLMGVHAHRPHARHQPGHPGRVAWRALAAVLLAGAGLGAAHATIVCCSAIDETAASGRTVELLFVAWENNTGSPKVSFVKDLGITMGDFFVNAQQDTGYSQAIWLGGTSDPAWTRFLATEITPASGSTAATTVDTSKLGWVVYAFDTNGGYEPGGLNLYTTLTQGLSGDPRLILGLKDLNNDSFGTSAGVMGLWPGTVNNLTANDSVQPANASYVIKISDGEAFPFGAGRPGSDSGVWDYRNNFGGWGAGNKLGQSSWFYAVTSSNEFASTDPVLVDEFDNTAHDGYWGLAASTDPDHVGEYLLSYTLQAVASPTEVAQNVLFGNSFARLAGTLSLSSPAGKAASVLSMTEGFLRGLRNKTASGTLAQATSASLLAEVSAVPEPASWALLVSGAGLLAALRRRRRAPG